ncbi:ATP-binding protein [Streptomyces sp. 8L]|uniref:ATP-binding protein n=1 Tax=Streptomyces sp. 8L TaxID=2877242 RepID=UPI001CD68D59|nr:ATP-binding protein [Streptomyces sp. 8L]MCA1219063.1 ATP-binding protein [Streptomyces sp. 8L]
MNHEVEWHFNRHPRIVARARSLLSVQAAEWKIPDEMAETGVLLLSELVTNALRHGGCAPGREIWTRALLDDAAERLRIEVSDACNSMPHARHASSDDETGRGLALVEALATRWGAEPRPYGIGKTVWFELAPVCGSSL